jgi:hypothetical protein
MAGLWRQSCRVATFNRVALTPAAITANRQWVVQFQIWIRIRLTLTFDQQKPTTPQTHQVTRAKTWLTKRRNRLGSVELKVHRTPFHRSSPVTCRCLCLRVREMNWCGWKCEWCDREIVWCDESRGGGVGGRGEGRGARETMYGGEPGGVID